MIIDPAELEVLIKAEHGHPHRLLGMHPCTRKGKKKLIVRALLLDAASCEVIDYESVPEKRYRLEKISPEGFFEGLIGNRSKVFPYRLRIERFNSEIRQFYDPYSFLPSLGEQDIYLFNEGNEHRIYQKLGAHLREIDGVKGVSFAVWAPNAKRVSVVGNFNNWDGRYHPMRPLGNSGIWEIFIPGLVEGQKYKFEILGTDGFVRLKVDPFGTYFEAPPHNASIIHDVCGDGWSDAEWLKARARTDWKKRPVSIYEMHPGSWKRVVEDGNRPLSYRELAAELVEYLKEMGYTHVEFLPLSEHPFDGSWGYQVTGFFAPTHRFGNPQDFIYLVNALHENGIGVILDWVPGHFPVDHFALAEFDGTQLFEHADPRQGLHQEWGTLVFNYGRHEVCGFLIASALSWLDRYHIDGLRVDAVASMLYLDYSREEGEWIPNQFGGRENIEAIRFLRKTNDLVHQYYPGVLMIAEESTAWPGVTQPTSEDGLGFDMKWNMGWMNDTCEYFSKDPIHRKWHQHNLTFGMVYQFSENFVQVYSHDEVVHGKSSMIMKMGAPSMTGKANNLRALYALMWAWPGKKTLFMGNDFGQSAEWHYDNSLDWHLLEFKDHEGVQLIVRDLNALYRASPVLFETDNEPGGFTWISHDDAESSVISFLRQNGKPEDTLAVVGHFTPLERAPYRIGVPWPGFWGEAINSDAKAYGGRGAGNLGGLHTDNIPFHDQPYSLELLLPGDSTLILKFEGDRK